MTSAPNPILIVDDNASIRKLLSIAAKRCNWATATAASGAEALAFLDAHPASLVLLDLRMPGMSGLDVLRAIRGRWSDAQLPVIMVTAEGGSDDIVTAFDLGASDYITKPVDLSVVQARVRTQLQRKNAEDRLRASEERYMLAAEGANDGLWDWNLATNSLYYSSRWKAIIGYEDEEIGDGIDEWLGRVHEGDIGRVRQELDAHLAGTTAHYECEHRMRHRSGGYRWVLTRGLAVRDATGTAIRMAGSQSDVTAGKVVDPLTNLPNRVLLADRLERAVNRPDRGATGEGVLFLDLDGFKLINDTFGHLFGDELLQAVAQRLRESLRDVDTIGRITGDHHAPTDPASTTLARLGGDEFVVLVQRIKDPSEPKAIAERLLRALAAPFQIRGREVRTSASIGIAVNTGQYAKAEDMLRDADTAMYRAKALGKGLCELFDSTMRESVVERMNLAVAVTSAATQQEFIPYFQPIVDCRTGRTVALEALLRWRRPGSDMAAPDVFLSALEDNGLLGQIGRVFFRDVCRQLMTWRQEVPGAAGLIVNVNFAGVQLSETDLLPALLKEIGEAGLTPADFVIEVTESTAVTRFTTAAGVLQAMRAAGFGIVLDDFGTGYSWLASLQSLPISGIKLDRSLIAARDAAQPAILKALVGLATDLSLTVTAEGIESPEQYSRVRDVGCHLAQGYLLGKPSDANEIARLLTTAASVTPGDGDRNGGGSVTMAARRFVA